MAALFAAKQKAAWSKEAKMGKRSNKLDDQLREDLGSYLDKGSKGSYTRKGILMTPNGPARQNIDPGIVRELDSSGTKSIDPGLVRKFDRKKERTIDDFGSKSYKEGGVTRADGCVTKGHTRGKMV